MIVKVCGMCMAQNIHEISKLDVDWIGLIFWNDSPRVVKQVASRGGFYPDYSSFVKSADDLGGIPERAKKVNKPLRVGVFVDEMPQTILTRVYNYYLDFVQLHGDEEPVMIENLHRTLADIRPVKVIKTIFVNSEEDFQKCKPYEDVVDYFLFHPVSEQKGGTGKRFDWSVVQVYDGKVPVLISGGIGPDDVEAIKAINNPMFAGVDINSRFETEVGVKDVEKVKAFTEALKR